MKRTDLVDKLEMIHPALSNNNLIPVTSHFWFRGDTVMAYNDAIAISVPLETEFECAVPGQTLLNLLKASKAPDVNMTCTKNELTIKAASSTFRLAIMDKSNFMFDMPKPASGAFAMGDRTRFMKCIDACLRSVSIDTTIPDQVGVTIMGDDTHLLFYSTNNATLSHADMKLDKPTKFDRAILSAAFCRELLSLCSKKGGVHLEVHKDYSLFKGRDGALLFGKLIEAPKPLNFPKAFEYHFPKGSEKRLVPVPTKLELILDRACIMAASNVTPVQTVIEVSDSKASFVTEATHGTVRDTVQFDKGQPNARLRVDPKLVKVGYGTHDKMLISDKAFIMTSGGIYYMVANSEV